MNRTFIIRIPGKISLIYSTALVFCAFCIIGSGCAANSKDHDPTQNQYGSDAAILDSSAAVLPGADGATSSAVSTADAGGQLIVTDAAQDGACTATGSEAVPIQIEKEVEVPVNVPQPVALYIMLDQSMSMFDSTTGIPYVPPWKWTQVYDAISAFVQDPASTALDVAIQYFPLAPVTFTDPDAGAPSEVTPECQGTEYLTPDVPMGRLPGQAQAMIDSLNLHGPSGQGTPIEPALRGAVDFCSQFMSGNANGEKCVVVLITDGMPNACTTDFTALANIAGNAYTSDPSVKTFAIGMYGADFTLLNQIGQQGGTDCTPNDAQTTACDVATGMTLLEAFELIREFIVETHVEIQIETQIVKMECQWEIPPPPTDETFDREKVNVEFSATGLVADKKYIVKIDAPEKCGRDLAWYYDNPIDPKQIVACPDTCSAIKAADKGKIRILLGCKTVVVE
jgi:hypothetical protein